VIGTPGYMSPEQARGHPVDERTDIWAFGCVLFECLSGGQVFAGRTPVEIFASILEREPDWDSLPEDTPQGVRTLLARSLAKDPKQRWASMTRVRQEIEGLLAPQTEHHARQR